MLSRFTRANRTSKIAGMAFLLILAVFTVTTPASALDNVLVRNITPYVAHVKVFYLACRGDSFEVNPGATSSAAGNRGGCLIRGITATLTGGPPVSSFEGGNNGTAYSKFAIVTHGTHTIVQTTR
jgi:hypothetical protein